MPADAHEKKTQLYSLGLFFEGACGDRKLKSKEKKKKTRIHDCVCGELFISKINLYAKQIETQLAREGKK